jgi:hypothetical protein
MATRIASERRKDPRIAVSCPAWIEGARGRLIACTVMNASVGGAQLCQDKHLVLPNQFSMRLTQDGKSTHECSVAWRKADQLGVRFVRP